MEIGIKTHAESQKEKQTDIVQLCRRVVSRQAGLFIALFSIALLFPNAVSAQSITWQPINNGLYGGQVNKILEHPSGALFARTEGKTTLLFRSGDAGATWRVLAPIEVDNFAISPDGTLLVATQEEFLYSTDEGETWTSTSLPKRFYRGLVVNEEGEIFGAASREIFKSTDNGQSWVLVYNELALDSFIRQLVITKNGTLLISVEWDGLFRSIDGGATWERTAFAGIDINFLTASVDGSVFVHLSLSGDFSNESFTGLQRSVDEGVTWMVVDTGYHDEYMGGNVFADAISVGPSGDLWIASPGGGIFRSMDGGTTWMPFGKVEHVETLAFTFTKAGDLFLGTSGKGICKFIDGEQTWEPSNTGLTATRVNALSIHPNGDVWIYAGGFYRSSDRGASWSQLEIAEGGPTATIVEILFGNQGEIYTHPTLFQSNDDGMTWQELPVPLTGVVYDLQVGPEGRLYVGASEGLFRLSDDQEEWIHLTDDVRIVHAIDFANNGDILVGTAYNHDSEDNGVFRSSDEGSTWASMLMEPFNDGIMALTVRPNGTILAGSEDSGVYRSVDDGYSFISIWKPRTFCCFGDFAIAPKGDIYASTINGVFLSTDDGMSWEDITQELPTRYLGSVAIDEEGYIYLATYGAGVYRSSTAVASSSQEV